MEKKQMRIDCWELKAGKEIPMPSTTTLDGFEWNGILRMRVSDDDGSLMLPFVFAGEDSAIMTVVKTEQDGKQSGNKKIKQILRCVPRSLGCEVICCRTRSYNGEEHVWSAWEQVSNTGDNGNEITWDNNSQIDTFTTAGIYNITGERTNAADGLPIANAAPGHTFHVRLVVLDSSITGTGKDSDKCITQMLMLSNRTGGDGDVYVRTGRAASINALAGGNGWEPWGKLQVNMGVGQVTSLDCYIDNGIYNGVYTNGTTLFETFVMVVINNYAVAGATGNIRSISQFKYALNVDGTFSYKTRTGQGTDSVEWGDWVDLGAATTADIQDNSITAQKLSTDVRTKVENPLRPLFIAAGAEYNDSGTDKTKTAPWGETVTHKAGHYYLNGLGDITEEQMGAIYAANNYALSENISCLFFQSKIRTNICAKGTGWSINDGTINARLTFYRSSVEIVVVANPNWDSEDIYCFQAGDVYNMFDNTPNLKRVVGIIYCTDKTLNIRSVFNRASQLRSFKIRGLNTNILLNSTAYLEKESLIYLLLNTSTTSALTITLHPDAYARLKDDADVVAALEAQPLVSLVSA